MKFQYIFLVILFALICLSCSTKNQFLEQYLEELKEKHSLEETPKLYVNDELVEYGQKSEGWFLLKEEDIISKDYFSKESLSKIYGRNKKCGVLHISTRFSEPPNSENFFDYPKYLNDSLYKNESLQKLNKEIHNSQLEAIKITDLKSARGISNEMEVQRNYFRNKYIHVVKELQKEYPKKALILYESYSVMCSGCGAEYVVLFNEEVLIRCRIRLNEGHEIDQVKYEVVYASKGLSRKKFYSDEGFLKLYKAALSYDNWNASSLSYGTDMCNDGSQSFYTIINPDGTMKSMYMRCWTGKKEKELFFLLKIINNT